MVQVLLTRRRPDIIPRFSCEGKLPPEFRSCQAIHIFAFNLGKLFPKLTWSLSMSIGIQLNKFPIKKPIRWFSIRHFKQVLIGSLFAIYLPFFLYLDRNPVVSAAPSTIQAWSLWWSKRIEHWGYPVVSTCRFKRGTCGTFGLMVKRSKFLLIVSGKKR